MAGRRTTSPPRQIPGARSPIEGVSIAELDLDVDTGPLVGQQPGHDARVQDEFYDSDAGSLEEHDDATGVVAGLLGAESGARGPTISSCLTLGLDESPAPPSSYGHSLINNDSRGRPRQLSNESSRSDSERHKSISRIFASLTLVMSVVGTGLLSLPAAFKCLGAVPGILVLAFVSLTMLFTGELILRAHLACQPSPGPVSYDSLTAKSCQAAGGVWLRNKTFVQAFVNAVNATGLFGGCCAYMTIGKDIFPTLRERVAGPHGHADEWYLSTDFVTLLLVALVSLPLCLLRDLSSLGYTSIVGFGFSLYMIVLVSARGFNSIYDGSAKWSQAAWGRDDCPEQVLWVSLVAAVSVFNFSFVFHFNVLPMFRELGPRQRTFRTMRGVLRATTFCCFVLYAVLGVAGYALFGRQTQDNILSNFDAFDDPINLARVAIAACCYLCLPLLEHPLRSTVLSLFHVRSTVTSRFIATIGLLVAQFVVALLAPSVKIVLQITGGSAIVGFCFIFPVGFALALVPERQRIRQRVMEPTLATEALNTARLHLLHDDLEDATSLEAISLSRLDKAVCFAVLVLFPLFGTLSLVTAK